MARLPCFFLEPTGRLSVSLRRYRSPKGHDELVCPVSRGGYHNASRFFQEEPEERDDKGAVVNGLQPVLPRDDPRWPRVCPCGYEFQEEDEWQRFTSRVYRRTDTGEEMTLEKAPPGAMWYADWFDDVFVPQGKHVLVVKTPGGEWVVDSQASNCGLPEDRQQKQHHCWIRHGDPPLVTADKDGKTCSAGAGSIQCGDYHGFLRHGFLED